MNCPYTHNLGHTHRMTSNSQFGKLPSTNGARIHEFGLSDGNSFVYSCQNSWMAAHDEFIMRIAVE
jgi:hypothetical protein